MYEADFNKLQATYCEEEERNYTAESAVVQTDAALSSLCAAFSLKTVKRGSDEVSESLA